ncbi:MAG: hypothetical protein D4R67_11960 [Bacteroidetes bacterium]|nr:MAG: hypothetical protein D4R67_11960 [Bacteroidota bacterium]
MKTIPAFRLRDDFPFLSSADCPAELKILVADKITAYHAYREAHKLLFEADCREKTFSAARDLVENYLENQLIYEELNYYKKHGKILGRHKIFNHLKRVEEIRTMKIGDLVRLKIRLSNNLVRNRKNLKNQPGHQDSGKRLERITQMELELTEVNRLLLIDE